MFVRSHMFPRSTPSLYHGELQKAENSPHFLLPFPLLAGGLGVMASLTVLVLIEEYFLILIFSKKILVGWCLGGLLEIIASGMLH